MSHTAPRPTHNRHAPKTQTTSPKTPQIHAFSPKWSAFWAIPCPAPVDWRGWKAPEGPEDLAAVPVGGGGAWPGIETTHRTRKQRPGTTGVEGAGGICRGAGGRWRGLAGLRDDAPISAPAPQVWRAPEGPEGLAAVLVGVGGAWPGFETTRRSAPQPHRCGGPRRDRRAWLRRPWAVAGPGRASRSTTPSRRLACGDLAGGPPPTAQHGLTKHTRRPKHPWRPTTTTTRPTRRAAHAGTGRGSG